MPIVLGDVLWTSHFFFLRALFYIAIWNLMIDSRFANRPQTIVRALVEAFARNSVRP